MPAKKRPNLNRSGVCFFADEYRLRHTSYARRSIRDVILLLLPRWRSMTMIEKKPYEDLAKQYKRARLLDNESVITPVIPSNEEELFLGKNSHENKFLDSYLTGELQQIYRREFLFVNFQLFCQTDLEDGGDFYPAEMAIMRYSFHEDVKDEFYTIIKPEKFPVGYTGTAIDHSRETHQIPPFDFIAAHGDYSQIWQHVQRVIGDKSLFKASPAEPIMIFCNAFERDQTMYLLKWLASKDPESDESGRKPQFDVYSFEALVAAFLRRLGHGDFAHQGVREQLRRPVYTLQIRDRCVYHDSLAIQHCSRAINHGFRLFLNDFIRQRLVELLPESVRQEIEQTTASQLLQSRINPTDQASSVNRPSTPSVKDSISSIFIEQQEQIPARLSQRLTTLSLDTKSVVVKSKPRMPSPIQIDCRWPSSPSFRASTSDDDDQYIMTGRGMRIVSQPSSSISSQRPGHLVYMHGIGRGRRPNVIPPVMRFPM